ncbi:DMT family transporter [Methanolobus sp. WCC4]|uniref:DMT family transporter n=1 Tax=Methanolobus sp. WCC4 TaxID=3125784 RepID=UPI0030FABC36
MELSVILFGLAAALCWGSADFSGGVASKRNGAMIVVVISQITGIILLASYATISGENIPSGNDIMWSVLAGLAGGAGLVALYHALATEKMGIVGPITAVGSAMVPMIFGSLTEGLPSVSQITGFAFAFAGVWLITRGESEQSMELKRLRFPVIAGTGFGLFMILIDQVQGTEVFWPLVGSRSAAAILTFCMILYTGRKLRTSGIELLPFILLAGFLDTGGNVFYVLAARSGRLDVAAILTSMYPAITVLLAWILLKERLSRRQWTGVFAVMVAVVLIA